MIPGMIGAMARAKVTRNCPRNALRILGTPGLFVRLIHVLWGCVIIPPSSSPTARTDEVRVTMVGGLRSRSLGFLAETPG